MSKSPRGRTRVLIVEDSPTMQGLLQHVIGRDPRLEVVGTCASAETAFGLISRVKPDVISLDVRLPGLDGVEATRRIMKEQPTPIVVVTGLASQSGLNISMEAMRAGALAVVEKPGSPDHPGFAPQAANLCNQLHFMSQVKVIRQRIGASSVPGAARAAVPAPPPAVRPATRPCVLGVAASTGGPPALVKLLTGLTAAWPLPILVVQHMGPDFLTGFAAWLGSVCPQPVQLASPRQPLQPGQVVLAPGDVHLTANAGGVTLKKTPPVCNQRPSADVLFHSLAENFGPAAIGVLLTGMGEDGARGLLAMRRAGGYTIAEDASTAVVNGMPGTAVALGAACRQLPVDAIAPHLVRLLAASAKEI